MKPSPNSLPGPAKGIVADVEQAVITKLNRLANGELVICSDTDLDAMILFDVSNRIRSRPNPNRLGTKDTWEAWIEKRDMFPDLK